MIEALGLTEEDFRYYNTALRKWTLETGVYTILIGSSSRRLPLTCQVAMASRELLTSRMSPE